MGHTTHTRIMFDNRIQAVPTILTKYFIHNCNTKSGVEALLFTPVLSVTRDSQVYKQYQYSVMR